MGNRFGVFAALIATAMWGSPVVAGPVSGQGTWESTLQARDLNGDSVTDAFYDTTLNVTWLANANANGAMTQWDTAKTWADNLVVGNYGDWRLPTMVDLGPSGCNFSYAGNTDCGYNVQTGSSEMAHLWYVTLGNKAFCPPGDATCSSPQAGWGLSNTGDFQNMQFYAYWSGLEFGPSTSAYAWIFNPASGFQYYTLKGDPDYSLFAMAVRTGDVARTVPEPSALTLLGLALVGLGFVRRKRDGHR